MLIRSGGAAKVPDMREGAATTSSRSDNSKLNEEDNILPYEYFSSIWSLYWSVCLSSGLRLKYLFCVRRPESVVHDNVQTKYYVFVPGVTVLLAACRHIVNSTRRRQQRRRRQRFSRQRETHVNDNCTLWKMYDRTKRKENWNKDRRRSHSTRSMLLYYYMVGGGCWDLRHNINHCCCCRRRRHDDHHLAIVINWKVFIDAATTVWKFFARLIIMVTTYTHTHASQPNYEWKCYQ